MQAFQAQSKVNEDGDLSKLSTRPRAGKQLDNELIREANARLKPWRDIAKTEQLPITQHELLAAVTLIDPNLRPSGLPSAITAGKRPTFWNNLAPEEIKPALVAAMLSHEGFSRISRRLEANSLNLPPNERLLGILKSAQDPDVKGLAVLIMLKQQLPTQNVEALREVQASAARSEFLSAILEVAAKRLNGALRAA